MIFTKDLLKFSSSLDILYVEDDEILKEATLCILNNLFGNVDSASNGKEGLEKYKSGSYDIVITDIQMPIMDGIEMVEAIREISYTQTVIVTSAHNESNLLTELIDLNVDGFSLKPINTDKLIATLYKASKSIQQQKEIDTYKATLEKMIADKTDTLERIIENLEYELKEKNIELDSVNSILKEQIYIDQLTGIYNSKKLDSEIKRQKELTDSSEGEFSLVLLDIDDFDSINQSFSRQEANKIIQEFSILVSKNIDDDAQFFRYAGVEFALIVDDTTSNTKDKIKELEELVSNYNFLNNVSLSISYGISTYTKDSNICMIDIASNKLKEYKSIK
jgi:diguanylate cyclase (GGDEF)-like protein